MKRFMVWTIALVFLFCTSAIAATTPAAPAPGAPVAEKKEVKKAEKKDVKKKTEKKTAGKVLEISDKTLKIERMLKGKAETIEFSLEKPFANIKVGDQLKVSYIEKDGQNVLLKVAPAQKAAVKKSKMETPKTAKPVATPAAPVTK
ncbi:MAG: hypothetical protein CO013_00615 [Syntrophobacterales bacterium CG_4_8_14_3_um_filter_58_8]|nr:MAG: hypothetical protein AUK26_02355 [Syntrophaceae bacterium CG2_30_58_14]PIV04296.1 MAG: hypothetical protein COS57_09160 [Syntrophobacterales bacterium CG03_land_8_20_14_0_80_58_14]PJC76234.1 MAG: hypothetical protein CO013_00615 [Syntrophobacterales bacterium CG_4_8_14_3_um_filter_58_8]